MTEKTKLERKFNMTGAYLDKSGKYGQHNMDMFFTVKGPKGGIEIQLGTCWCLPETQESNLTFYKDYLFGASTLLQPSTSTIFYHHKEPQYLGQPCQDNCMITEGSCYPDMTLLYFVESWMEGFLHGGSEWLFERMEELYEYTFNDGPKPNLTPIPKDFTK